MTIIILNIVRNPCKNYTFTYICKIEFMLGFELLTLNVGVKSKPARFQLSTCIV